MEISRMSRIAASRAERREGCGTAAGNGARFMGLVHHTDAEREWAYDQESHVGRLDKALLDEAQARGWTVVNMKQDWKRVFVPETNGQTLQPTGAPKGRKEETDK